MNAGDRIRAYVKRNLAQKDYNEVKQEAIKIQRGFRNTKTMKLINNKTFSAKRNAIEVSQRPMPARLSGVHETTRQGATKTRIHEQNQLIEQLRQQKPKRPSTGTEISNATTAAPQPTKAKPGRPSKVSSGQDEGPREIGSARTLVVGSVYEKKTTPKLRLPKKK